MIVLDANVLLYAYNSASDLHARARAWIEAVLSGIEPVGIPWQTVSAFVRIMTNTRLPGERLTTSEAVQVIADWLAQPNVQFLAPGEHHWGLFRQMMIDGQASGPLVTDASLAAVTLEYGGTLYTTDRDFARFPGLRWINPLA